MQVTQSQAFLRSRAAREKMSSTPPTRWRNEWQQKVYSATNTTLAAMMQRAEADAEAWSRSRPGATGNCVAR